MMTFREKSAWAMGTAMIVCGLWYASLAAATPMGASTIVEVGALVPFVLAVVSLSILVQIVLAATAPKTAAQAADERERIAIDRAGRWAGVLLATGVVSAAAGFIWTGNGAMLFRWIVGALIVAQIGEMVFQIYLFRRGV